ncbi:MAG: PhnD/SsuA/transferrin family substrate-binding protein [Myxococcales bacterium]|nr:PhnD/SsuA/transferrin family substrate-binding protein [Myxococcales bacterium]
MSAISVMMLICFVGGPGNHQQAQPVVDQFLRHVERSAGWADKSSSGAFFSRRSRCVTFFEQKKPAVVVLDLASYLALRTRWKLSPLAQMGRSDKKRYFVLVRDGSVKKLADLKGKKVVSTIRDTKFLSKIVFGGKLDAAKHFTLSFTRRPLKGVRKVARKQADATIVDEQVMAHLGSLKLGVKLVPLHRSAKLPGLTMTVRAGTPKKVPAQLRKALPKLCKGAGSKLCKTFSISAFLPAKRALYKRLERKYK